MPDTHRIIITAEALEDLEGTVEYINRHSPQNAAGVAAAILRAIDSLSSFPSRFKRVGQSRKRGTPVHAMVVRPFVVYYRVEAEPAVVFILAVRHGARRRPRHFS